VLVGCQDFLSSAEGADQHEQCGLRQVEIGQHCLDHLEFEAWVDEEVGSGRACNDFCCADANCVFESSNRGGADGDYATFGAESVVDDGGGAGGDGIRFGMEFVKFDLVDAYGLESSQADVERDFGGLDAALADAVEDFRGEVKAGGGSGYRSALLGIDSLIAFAIAGRVGARDVGRERDVADAIEGGEEGVGGLKGGREADAALAELGAGQDIGLQFVLFSEEKAFAYADLAAGTNQALPIVGFGGDLPGEQNLDAAVEEVAGCGIVRADGLSAGAFAAAVEPGGKDAGIVEDYEIAGVQQVGEVAEKAIGIVAARALQVQHTGAVTGGEGFLGNQPVGKVEVEIGNQHGVRL